jgi:hypothetical protein
MCVGLEWPLTSKMQRNQELAVSIPGEYFIFCLTAGHRLFLKPGGEYGSSETKQSAGDAVRD